MENFIIIALLIVIIGLAALYIYRQKKKGNKCIGCPNSHLCNHDCKQNKNLKI